MKIGAIDIGTNSVRLLVANKINGKLKKLVSELRVPRLGTDIHQTGVLKAEAIQRTIEVLKEYKKIIDELDAQPYAVATSAVRDASNQQEFLSLIREKVGLEIGVISGLEEARLSYLGITSAVSNLVQNVLAIDIGGGSTEFIFGNSKEVSEYNSINLGAVRLTDSYNDNVDEMRLEAKKMIEEVLADKEVYQLVGVGGTVTTLVAIEEGLDLYDPSIVHGYNLSKKVIIRVLEELNKLSLSQRKKIIGLSPKRADIILAGIVILLEIMEIGDLSQIKVSEASILEGVIYDKS